MGLLLLAAFTVYIGDITPTSVLIAWGQNAGEGNRIGLAARSWGQATVRVEPHTVSTEKSWARVEGLSPDTAYTYSIAIGGAPIAEGRFRTWPAKADRLAFLVLGDYGTGDEPQRRIARAMAIHVAQRAATANPIRFVLTTGDNIYADRWAVLKPHTGAADADWWPKFFEPYAPILASIPFFATPGNHDGNESERHADLPVYLDNFFFPGGTPARWYHFNYGGLADFFALDSTRNTFSGLPRPAFDPGGPQSLWLKAALEESKAPWKIPYFHHSIFDAGPRHASEHNELTYQHWLEMFAAAGVKVSFQGHEHNFQASLVNDRSRHIQHFVTGAGGELRDDDVRRRMPSANVGAWAPQHHFLLVEIDGRSMTVTPFAESQISVSDSAGHPVDLPFIIK